MKQQSDRDFFVHLRASREKWRRRYGGEVLAKPSILSTRKHHVFRPFPTEEEVWAIVNAERNPVFKSIFLGGAFGGIRLSEQINAWQQDILPGSCRRYFFDVGAEEEDTLLFLRADPARSTYIGDPFKEGLTRRDFLITQYGVLPRNQLPKSAPLYAGWKGTSYFGKSLTHMV